MTDDAPWPEHPPDLDADTDIGTYPEPEPLPVVHAGGDVDQSRRHWEIQGNQTTNNVTINQYVADLVRAILPKRHTRAEVLAEQLRCYLPPKGLAEMAWSLAAKGLVVLLCPAVEQRCGQRAAAAYLVHQRNQLLAPDPPLDLQELLDSDEKALQETIDGTTGVALSMDWSDEGPDPAVRLLRQLGVLENRLSENGCVAVVAIPEALAGEARKQFPGQVHTLGRPPAEDVFRIRSTRLTPPLLDALTGDTGLTAELRDAWPPQAIRIAKLADEAYGNGITDVPGIRDHVRAALSDWREEARQELLKHSTAPQRALLLATAMLENSGPVTVVKGRELLLRASDYPAEPVNALEGTDVVTELQMLGNLVDAHAARFRRADFGTALLHLAWREYPGLRHVLLKWLDRLPGAVATRTMSELDGLSQRVVALSARDGGGQIAVAVARRWAGVSPGPDTARRVAAVLLLREACLHPRIGRDMRHRVYQDSYYGGGSPRFRAALAEAIGWFDVSHQAAAMTRLKHLARGPEEEVTSAVVEAVARLAGEMTLGQLLRYLADWLHAGDPRRAEVAAAAAIRAMESPGTLRADSIRVADSTAFWRKALGCLPSRDVAALVRSLFRVTGPNPDDRGAVVFHLCHAAGADLRRVGQLLYATRPVGHEIEDEALNDLFQQVRLRLDELLPTHPDEQES